MMIMRPFGGLRLWACIWVVLLTACLSGLNTNKANGQEEQSNWKFTVIPGEPDERRVRITSSKDPRLSFNIRLRRSQKGFKAPAQIGPMMVLYEGQVEPVGFAGAIAELKAALLLLGLPQKDPFLQNYGVNVNSVKKPKFAPALRSNLLPRLEQNYPRLLGSHIQWLTGLALVILFGASFLVSNSFIKVLMFSPLVMLLFLILFGIIYSHFLEVPAATFPDRNRVVLRSSTPPLHFKRTLPGHYVLSETQSGFLPQKRNPDKRIVWIFGESSSLGWPYGPSYSIGAMAAKSCKNPDTLFVTIGIDGLRSEGWLRLAQEVLPLAQKNDSWVLFAGHNDPLVAPSLPPPPIQYFQVLPFHRTFLWPLAQSKNLSQPKSDFHPGALPFVKTLFAFKPDPVGPIFPFHLKKWSELADQKNIKKYYIQLPECLNCPVDFRPLKLKPSKMKNSRGWRHTRIINQWLKKADEEGTGTLLPLSNEVFSKVKTIYDRNTLDNHHPTLQKQWWLGQNLARTIDSCKSEGSIGPLPHPSELMNPDVYVQKISKMLSGLPWTRGLSPNQLLIGLILNEAEQMLKMRSTGR